MKILLSKLLVIIIIIFSLANLNACVNRKTTDLQHLFLTPPDSVALACYWYWINDNISVEGVVKDLEAMAEVGIRRVFIGNIGLASSRSIYGKVNILSPEWWEAIHQAMKTATQLGLEIGVFNSPGWSQSGGPWVNPERSMRFLNFKEHNVKGRQQLELLLAKSSPDFEQVKVIAFPTPKAEIDEIKVISTNYPVLFDKDTSTTAILTNVGDIQTIDFSLAEKSISRSLIFHFPMSGKWSADVELQANENGNYQTVKKFRIDRRNMRLEVGFIPNAPIIIALDDVHAKDFRLVFSDIISGVFTYVKGEVLLSEIELTPAAKLENAYEKQLAKMFQEPLPYWKEYQWKPQYAINDKELTVNSQQVIDITDKVDSLGILRWQVPEGQWTVMQYGMTSTGVTNHPAAPAATGLEIDKMSREHVAYHFDAYIGEILRRIPAADRKSFKVVVQDSYETGSQNWTDNMIDIFEKRYGYSPLPYLPVFSGRIVGNPNMSDRFLWDLRRLVADKVAYDYVGGLRDVAHKNGLITWLENYGHWGFPGEFLQYGGQSDEVAGEFWNEGNLGNVENRAASSAAHIYGKRKVYAESFTAGGKSFMRYPELLKRRGDWAFTEGINSTLLHVFIHQPYEEKNPGVNEWFSTEFNRKNTWFYAAKPYYDYLRRCNLMLQQGTPVVDLAYFIGEDAPKMTGICDPEVPAGYSFDYINAEVILKRLTVKNGKLTLPEGIEYSMLVLPKLNTMRPELLEHIGKLIAEGAVVMGPAPTRSPSLENYPEADKKVQALSQQIWGTVDGKNIKQRKYGKGLIVNGLTIPELFSQIGLKPDCAFDKENKALFVHRKTADKDIYFISNQTDTVLEINPAFRVKNRTPQWWDATTGKVRSLKAFQHVENQTIVPMRLAAYESAFIVFVDSKEKPISLNVDVNFPEYSKLIPLNNKWKIEFDSIGQKAPASITTKTLFDWTSSTDERVKYYSGTATYTTEFNQESISENEKYRMNFGKVANIANLKINGRYVGGVWTAPWKLDITEYLKRGKNTIEINVTNTWNNRLIGDNKLPENERKTWTIINNTTANSPLQPAGLIGPVIIEVY